MAEKQTDKQVQPDADSAEKQPARAPRTVKMKRGAPQFPGGPTEAAVHPDEVQNYSRHGWVEA